MVVQQMLFMENPAITVRDLMLTKSRSPQKARLALRVHKRTISLDLEPAKSLLINVTEGEDGSVSRENQ